jgi:hypothetical protein
MGFLATDNGPGCQMDVSWVVDSESQIKQRRGSEIKYLLDVKN